MIFMSSVVKISRTKSSAGIRLQNILDSGDVVSQTEDDYWKKKIAEEQQKYFNNGKEAALAELEAKYAQNLLSKYSDFEKLSNSINNAFAEYEKSFEKIVVDLSIQIAERIIRREITEKSIVEKSITEASQKIIGADSIVIKLNPSDYELLEDSGKGLFSNENFSKINFETDDKVAAGGCLIESDIGNVDARITTQIAELKQKIESNYLNDTE